MYDLFRRWWLGHEDRIAVDIQDGRVVIVSERAGARRASSTRVVELSCDRGRHLGICDALTLVEEIRESLFDIDCHYSRLGVVLSPNDTLCARLSGVPRSAISNSGRARALVAERLSLSPEEYRVRVIPREGADGEIECEVIATRRSTVEAWLEAARRLGAELVAMVPRPYALMPALRALDCGQGCGTSLVVDLTESAASLYVYVNGEVARTTIVGGLSSGVFRDSLSEAVLKIMSGSGDGAVGIGVLGEAREPMRAALDESFWRRLANGRLTWTVGSDIPARSILEAV